MAESIRVQKYCADCGVCSRRAAEEAIAKGEIRVNGIPAFIGQKIDPDRDTVEYRGQRILPSANGKHYIMLNKPRGIVCTAKDEKGRTPVTDLVRIDGVRLYPVGRLDMDSDGLLLLTDDGDLANRLTHPRHEIPKIYEVTLTAPATERQLAALTAPMELDGYPLRPVGLRVTSANKLELTLWEGRNRQIRRMCEKAGLGISRLCRVALGELKLGDLPAGKWRALTDDEVNYLNGNNNTISKSEN